MSANTPSSTPKATSTPPATSDQPAATLDKPCEDCRRRLVRGNVSMATSKFFSGLNENALRYLLPHWMSAWSGVMLRMGFAAVAFWIISIVSGRRGHASTSIPTSMKIKLMGLGFFFMLGYMLFLLLGLTYTTPIVSAIFISTEPVWVFILCMIFFHEKATRMKILGILLGLGGALLCIITQHHDAVLAPDPLLGALFCFLGSVIYSGYLVISKRLLGNIDSLTVSKWSFTGGACSAAILVSITGWYAPVLEQGLFSTPMLALLFILVFPTTVSYLLLDVGLRSLSATVVSLYGYMILIVATVASYILGQARFDWFQMLAIAMIVFSVYFVEVAETKKRRQNLSVAPAAQPSTAPSSQPSPATASTPQPSISDNSSQRSSASSSSSLSRE